MNLINTCKCPRCGSNRVRMINSFTIISSDNLIKEDTRLIERSPAKIGFQKIKNGNISQFECLDCGGKFQSNITQDEVIKIGD